MIKRVILAALLLILRITRGLVQTEPRLFAVLGSASCQPLLAWIGRMKAFEVYLKARRDCPAYRDFLLRQGAAKPVRSADFSQIPATTKDNYVRAYGIEERCHGGRIPHRGVVIDESSGSSGIPNNWVRGSGERASVRTMMQISYALMFGAPNFLILNCFALGPWATGMNVSMSLVDVAILKSIGPDKGKLENTLRLFGTKYRYLIAGYPPFVKNFLDTTELDLTGYELHLILGGEGMSEGLRAYFLTRFRSVFSSYGASDLEINIGAETNFTVALRQACWKDSRVCRALFGRDDPPMIFQYNPLDYLIECNDSGELLFTINRVANAAPKVRYNLHDLGGVYPYRELQEKLGKLGGAGLVPVGRALCFPVLFIYGRNDLSVPFFGAKIFTSDLESILHSDAALTAGFNSFHIQNEEDAQFNRQLRLDLELAQGRAQPLTEEQLQDVFFTGLMRVNQDFREISQMITPGHLRVHVHDYQTGPFAGRDIRVKNRYVT